MSRALASCCLLLAGCRTIEGTRGLPPFYEVYESPSTLGAGKGGEVYYRPLFSSERSGEAKDRARRIRSFPPFLDFQWGPEGEKYWVLPLFAYRSLQQPFGGRDLDWMLLPCFFGGSDPEEGGYFAVLPLGGKLKGLLGQDEIDFVLFPLYWRSRDRRRHSLHLVWPLYNTVWGGDWEGSRLWPFYGRYRSYTPEGGLRYHRYFVMWPFYIRRQDEMNVNPTEFTFLFPFYGERRNRRVDSRTYLWPLFQYHHDRRYDRTLYMGFLFPYRVTYGQTDIWPFYGVKQLNRGTSVGGVVRRTYRQFCLWPIERYEWASDGLEETTRFWLLPLLWHFYYIDNRTLQTTSLWSLWPLFRYSREGKEVAFDLISPLWFRREEYDRHYSRWFNIFRYRWKEEPSGWEVFYGALSYRVEPGRGERLLTLLGGLFECGKRGGDLAFRLLYIPWW